MEKTRLMFLHHHKSNWVKVSEIFTYQISTKIKANCEGIELNTANKEEIQSLLKEHYRFQMVTDAINFFTTAQLKQGGS